MHASDDRGGPRRGALRSSCTCSAQTRGAISLVRVGSLFAVESRVRTSVSCTPSRAAAAGPPHLRAHEGRSPAASPSSVWKADGSVAAARMYAPPVLPWLCIARSLRIYAARRRRRLTRRVLSSAAGGAGNLPDNTEARQLAWTNALVLPLVLVCEECSRRWNDPHEHWRVYLSEDEQSVAVLYCPECARREFSE
jgi:hypothetical protein